MARPVVGNPFKIHGVVQDEYFTNRADELKRIIKTLREPGAKLLVYGPRRMGKTSALKRAVLKVASDGGHTVMADLSTASSLTDVGNRVLASGAASLGRNWSNWVQDLASRLQVRLKLVQDPNSGFILPSLDVGLRSADLSEQQETLGKILDAIDAMARDAGTTIGVVLDEFQEISRIGGESSEWHLRGTIQNHQHVSYVFSGSAVHMIERMVNEASAFYDLLDVLYFGPIEPSHLATWIDGRMQSFGVAAVGVGRRAVELVGPRTRDIVQVARRCYDRTAAKGEAGTDDVDSAFREIVGEEGDLFLSRWENLTSHQQNVLRAVAATTEGLTTKATMQAFSLGSSGTATNTATALMGSRLLLKVDSGSGYEFDDPYFKGWVQVNTLRDIGAPTVINLITPGSEGL